MRLIDADKLYPDRMTNKGNIAISQSQIAKAPTVDAIQIGKVMNMIDEIQAEIEKYNSDCRWALSEENEKCIRCTEITFSRIQSIINEKVKEYTDCTNIDQYKSYYQITKEAAERI